GHQRDVQAIERFVVGGELVALDLDRGAVVAFDLDVAQRVVDRQLGERMAGGLDRQPGALARAARRIGRNDTTRYREGEDEDRDQRTHDCVHRGPPPALASKTSSRATAPWR